MEELRQAVLRLNLLFRDDTVIMIRTARGCLRFYGNEKLALYKAHRHKDKEGLYKDNILALLPAETVVMHDHNKVNYNEAYHFSNVECNAHLVRDLQKIIDNQLGHEWAKEVGRLIADTYKARTEAVNQGVESFDEADTEAFFEVLNRAL
jgi:hypothetical protein